MKKSLLLLSWLFPLLTVFAEEPTVVAYKAAPEGDHQAVTAIYSDGSQKQAGQLPKDAPAGRKGGSVRYPYAPEPKQVFNPEQFGSGKYYSPTFRFSVDWNPGFLTPEQRRAQGVNLFNFWTLSDTEKASLPFGDGMIYVTESGLHQELEGAGYFESSLQAYYNKIWKTCPSAGSGGDPGAQFVIFNIEQSNGWGRGNYGSGSHWPSWESCKTHSIVCESDGVTRTLEEIDKQNLWEVETQVRRANRLTLLIAVAKEKGKPGTMVSYGSSMYQGLPRVDFQDNSRGIFQPGSADVSHIGGTREGVITLKKPGGGTGTYTLTGNQWDKEDFMMGYYYLFNFDISRSDYNDIWVNKKPGTQTFPYLWSKIKIRHIVAEEKGYLQLNRKRMQHLQRAKRGIMRMQETMYEADAAGVVDGTFPAEIHRIPFAELQPSVTGDSEAPKIWQPPYLNYSRYCVTRFMAGNDPGWGYYVFPTGPDKVRIDLSKSRFFNHHLHSYTTLFQARNDMQPYEKFYTDSTLVEDPEVQLNQVGPFAAYDGVAAYNYDDGKTGIQKPAYMLRYKKIATGWHVVILGGMIQGWTAERTDVVRVPGGGLNGNCFRVKLRGPSAQVYQFDVKATDKNQYYDALPMGNPNWEKPGYAGRVGGR